MKQVQVLISAIVAAVVSVAVVQAMWYYAEQGGAASAAAGAEPPAGTDALGSAAAGEGAAVAGAPLFRVTEALVEDGWVNAARGAGADHKPLAHAATSICYLTKIEIKGIQSPADANSCTIDVDEFTGYWQVTAAVEEGGASEVRCNARCLVWGEEEP